MTNKRVSCAAGRVYRPLFCRVRTGCSHGFARVWVRFAPHVWMFLCSGISVRACPCVAEHVSALHGPCLIESGACSKSAFFDADDFADQNRTLVLFNAASRVHERTASGIYLWIDAFSFHLSDPLELTPPPFSPIVRAPTCWSPRPGHWFVVAMLTPALVSGPGPGGGGGGDGATTFRWKRKWRRSLTERRSRWVDWFVWACTLRYSDRGWTCLADACVGMEHNAKTNSFCLLLSSLQATIRVVVKRAT